MNKIQEIMQQIQETANRMVKRASTEDLRIIVKQGIHTDADRIAVEEISKELKQRTLIPKNKNED